MANRRDFIKGLMLATAGMAVPEALAQKARPAPAPIVQTPPTVVGPTPGELRDQGMAYADQTYLKLLPPLPAEAAVQVDRAPPPRGGIGASIGFGPKPVNPTEGLISGTAKDLDAFVKTAQALQKQAAFDPKGDPFQNGVNQEAKRIFALQTQDAINKFKQTVALEQFLRQSNNEDIAVKIAIQPQDQNYSLAMAKSPPAADKMLQDTMEQATNLAQALRISIGEYKSAQKHAGVLGNLTAGITNGSRTQNRVYTAVEASAANHMRAELRGHETAFTSLITGPSNTTPADPYATPATKPADPYGAPQAGLRDMTKPSAKPAPAAVIS